MGMDISLHLLSSVPFLVITFFLPKEYQSSRTYGFLLLLTILLLLPVLRRFESSAPGSATRRRAKDLLSWLSLLGLLESNYATVAYLEERGGDLISAVDGVVAHGCFLLLLCSLILLHVRIRLDLPIRRWLTPAVLWLVAEAAAVAAVIWMLVAAVFLTDD